MSKDYDDQRRKDAEEIELGSRVTSYSGWVDKDRSDDKSDDSSNSK